MGPEPVDLAGREACPRVADIPEVAVGRAPMDEAEWVPAGAVDRPSVAAGTARKPSEEGRKAGCRSGDQEHALPTAGGTRQSETRTPLAVPIASGAARRIVTTAVAGTGRIGNNAAPT